MSIDYDNTASDPQCLATAEALALEPFYEWLNEGSEITDMGPEPSVEDHGGFYFYPLRAEDTDSVDSDADGS